MQRTETSGAEILAVATDVIGREARMLLGLIAQATSQICDVARMLAACEGHVLVTGAGTSSAVARRFAHLLSCSGTPALYIDATECLHGGSGAITARDLLYVVSKGGKSAEVNRVAAIARSRGARVIAQTEVADSPLAQQSDALLVVETPREVDLFGGLLALGSSLAACAIGDALCAVLLVERRYTIEEFGRTHPGGAVGEAIAELMRGPDEKTAAG